MFITYCFITLVHIGGAHRCSPRWSLLTTERISGPGLSVHCTCVHMYSVQWTWNAGVLIQVSQRSSSLTQVKKNPHHPLLAQGVTNKMLHVWSLADRRHEHTIMSGDVTTPHCLHDITHRGPVTSPPRSCHQTMSLRYLFEILISDGMCGQEDLTPGMSWVLTNRTEYTKRSPELPFYNIHMVISAILRKWNWDSTSILTGSRTKIRLQWLICYESCDVGSSEATVIIIISLVSLCSYLARIVGCRKCLNTEASWVMMKVSYLINTRTHPLALTDYQVQSIDVRG